MTDIPVPLVGTKALIEALEALCEGAVGFDIDDRGEVVDAVMECDLRAILARYQPGPVLNREAVECVLEDLVNADRFTMQNFEPLSERPKQTARDIAIATDAILALGTEGSK